MQTTRLQRVRSKIASNTVHLINYDLLRIEVTNLNHRTRGRRGTKKKAEIFIVSYLWTCHITWNEEMG